MIYIIFHKTLKQILNLVFIRYVIFCFFKNVITFVNCLFFSNLRKYAVFISIFYPVCSRTYFEFLFINSDNPVSNSPFLFIFSVGKFFLLYSFLFMQTVFILPFKICYESINFSLLKAKC